MPAQTRLLREREKRAAESPDARKIRLQQFRQRRSTTSPGRRQATLWQEREWARARRARSPGIDKPVNLAHVCPTMLCIHLVLCVWHLSVPASTWAVPLVVW